MKDRSDYFKGVLAASITAILWGFLPVVLKVSLMDLSPVDVSWARFAVAFTVLLVFQAIRSPRSLKIFVKPPPLILVAAVCLGLNYLGLISGIHFTTPAIAEIFIQSGAIFLAIVGFLFFREKAGIRQVTGLIIVIGGLVIFYREQITILAENLFVYQKGVALTLFGGTMWTCYAILQRGLVKKRDPLELNLVLFGIPALGFLPFIEFRAFFSLSPLMWMVIIFLGLNTLLAYGAIAYALKYLDASKVSVIVTLNPVITFTTLALLMYFEVSWMDKEKFTWITILGALMVVLGAILTIWKRKA